MLVYPTEVEMTIRPFTTILRKLGFILEYRYKRSKNAPGVSEFRATKDRRVIMVQLWSNGHHRVSHGILNKYGLHKSTIPTDFETIEEMKAAIELEWKRETTISKGYIDPGM